MKNKGGGADLVSSSENWGLIWEGRLNRWFTVNRHFETTSHSIFQKLIQNKFIFMEYVLSHYTFWGAGIAQWWEHSPPTVWPRFESWTQHHSWVEFVIIGSHPYSERFFSGYSGFPLSSKTNLIFQIPIDICDVHVNIFTWNMCNISWFIWCLILTFTNELPVIRGKTKLRKWPEGEGNSLWVAWGSVIEGSS